MPRTKRRPLPAPIPRLMLPKTFKPSDKELAVSTRLIRAMREGDYWLPAFIEWLLYQDASAGVYRVTVADVKKELALHSTAKEDDEAWLENIVAAHPELFAKTASKTTSKSSAGKKKPFEPFPEDEEEEFYQLIRQWRLEYPEPPKRLEFPKGKTQHEMDPDSD